MWSVDTKFYEIVTNKHHEMKKKTWDNCHVTKKRNMTHHQLKKVNHEIGKTAVTHKSNKNGKFERQLLNHVTFFSFQNCHYFSIIAFHDFRQMKKSVVLTRNNCDILYMMVFIWEVFIDLYSDTLRDTFFLELSIFQILLSASCAI